MLAKVRDTELFFDIDGAALVADGTEIIERPTAILVHGGPGFDHTGLKARYGKLSSDLQLVYFDHRGHGRSRASSIEHYCIEENADDMEALRTYLGLESIVSIGTSYGGMVAMAHAARYPSSVSHLILVATAAHSGMITKAEEIVAQRGSEKQIEAVADLFGGNLDTSEKMRMFMHAMGPLYSKRSDPALSGDGLKRAILSPEPLNAAFGKDGYLKRFDLRPLLPRITARTLVLAGRHDWICAPEFSVEISQLIPHAELRIFERSSHSVGSDEPDAFANAVKGFLVYNSAACR